MSRLNLCGITLNVNKKELFYRNYILSKLYFKFNEYEITQLDLNILNSRLVSTPPEQRTWFMVIIV